MWRRKGRHSLCGTVTQSGTPEVEHEAVPGTNVVGPRGGHTVILVFVAATPAGAQTKGEEAAAALGIQVNLLWVVIGAVLVIFMQAGFALVETGFCRAKHAAHVVSTNFAIFGLGFVGFFLVGYALRCSAASRCRLIGHERRRSGRTCIGSGNWVFLWKGGWASASGKAVYAAGGMAFFLYMVAFMDTVATIPTGAMAERWKWNAFVGWGLFCGAIYYPLFGAWTWGGGWLAKLGNTLRARASATSTSPVPASCTRSAASPALAGAIVLGPRIGKYDKDGSANAIAGPPHPDGDARHVHPAVRLVRLQRRIDVRGHRRAVRGRRGEHRDRGRVRCRRGDVLDHACRGRASPIPG